ncbi:LysR family transcriptional regulator, partial [Raoultella terrigena]|uniref:LysR family transcriptional regulator n=1 Tax=Raoultella terrigena TaxID=577 RepID=UPI00132FDD13
TKAANALYIAQPSLSQAIRSLEREVGVELFDRTGRSMTLTPAGEVFEVGARAVIRAAARARAGVAPVRDLHSGRLGIAASSAMALGLLPAAVARLRARHPNLQLMITEPGSPSEIVTDVRLGRAEIGLTYLDVDTGPLVTAPF